MSDPRANTQPAERRSVLCGLIGSGIGRSLTPRLQEAEGRAQGLTYVFRIIDIDGVGGAEALPRLLRSASDMGFDGLNVTHPCKQQVLPLLDEISPLAARLGAVNTVKITDDGRFIGHNTDCTGFGRNLAAGLGDRPAGHVVQVGAGGAGAAVADATLEFGATGMTVVDVDPARAAGLAAELEKRFPGRLVAAAGLNELGDVLTDADGVVHATPMGMAAHPGTAFDPALLRPDLWLAEVVYRPAETELLRRAREMGVTTISGIGMAVGQAIDSFAIFTGLTADAARMTRTMEELLAAER